MHGDSLYMMLSALAYESPEYVQKQAPRIGFIVTKFLTDGSSQGYLFTGGHRAILAYRGTEASSGNLWDIGSNLRFHAREWEGPGKAHLGYVRQYRRIRDELLMAMADVSNEIPLIVTGHSMGGAMATMAAADAFGQGFRFHRLVTFGSPGTLNAKGHAAIKCPHTRYVNCLDWAPSWPPSCTIGHGVAATRIDSKISWLKRHFPPSYLRAMASYEENRNPGRTP